jgi:hypothetical protein
LCLDLSIQGRRKEERRVGEHSPTTDNAAASCSAGGDVEVDDGSRDSKTCCWRCSEGTAPPIVDALFLPGGGAFIVIGERVLRGEFDGRGARVLRQVLRDTR